MPVEVEGARVHWTGGPCGHATSRQSADPRDVTCGHCRRNISRAEWEADAAREAAAAGELAELELVLSIKVRPGTEPRILARALLSLAERLGVADELRRLAQIRDA